MGGRVAPQERAAICRIAELDDGHSPEPSRPLSAGDRAASISPTPIGSPGRLGRGRFAPPPTRWKTVAVRAVVQRVSSAGVTVDGRSVGAIGAGLLVLLGVAEGDSDVEAERLAGKIARLRIFAADDGRFDRSLLDTSGEALVVSQFTLLADSKQQKGTRPDFSKAARPEIAEPLYEHFCEALRELGVHVQAGVFGARMAVALVNDGPVTIVLDVEASSDSTHPEAPGSFGTEAPHGRRVRRERQPARASIRDSPRRRARRRDSLSHGARRHRPRPHRSGPGMEEGRGVGSRLVKRCAR